MTGPNCLKSWWPGPVLVTDWYRGGLAICSSQIATSCFSCPFRWSCFALVAVLVCVLFVAGCISVGAFYVDGNRRVTRSTIFSWTWPSVSGTKRHRHQTTLARYTVCILQHRDPPPSKSPWQGVTTTTRHCKYIPWVPPVFGGVCGTGGLQGMDTSLIPGRRSPAHTGRKSGLWREPTSQWWQ